MITVAKMACVLHGFAMYMKPDDHNFKLINIAQYMCYSIHSNTIAGLDPL